MKKFKLVGVVTVSVYTEVESETLEEAIEIAEGRSIEHSQFHSKEQMKKVWVNDEYDGVVEEIEEI